MLISFKRRWCQMFHRDIKGLWGRSYECRTCGQRFENPALDGTVLQLPPTRSVRVHEGEPRVTPIQRRARG